MKHNKIIGQIFPINSYPVLYRSYWMEGLGEKYRVKNNITGEQLQAIQQVYKTYYNIILDTTTLSTYTYSDDRTPFTILFVVNYLHKGRIKYLWEYFHNWVGILELNEN